MKYRKSHKGLIKYKHLMVLQPTTLIMKVQNLSPYTKTHSKCHKFFKFPKASNMKLSSKKDSSCQIMCNHLKKKLQAYIN